MAILYKKYWGNTILLEVKETFAEKESAFASAVVIAEKERTVLESEMDSCPLVT